jgi:CAAX protease family protein
VRVLPFALFMAMLAVQPLLGGHVDPRWVVAGRGVLVGGSLLLLWRDYGELRNAARLRAADVLLAIVTGIAVFLAWIAFDSGWGVLGTAGAGFDPRRADGSLDPLLTALRVVGLVLVVPVMEELFWRSYVMRRIDAAAFLARNPRDATPLALGLSCALFASEHVLWFAGLVAGAAYGVLYMRSRNLWIPILSHATTNGILAAWILATRNWHLW